MAAVSVLVRYTGGAYIARGGGKSASCTVGVDAALERLAEKLGFGANYQVTDRERVEQGVIRCVMGDKPAELSRRPTFMEALSQIDQAREDVLGGDGLAAIETLNSAINTIREARAAAVHQVTT